MSDDVVCVCAVGAVDLRNAIASRYSINLPATIIYDYPSPAALTVYLAAQLATKSTSSTASITPAAELDMSTGTMPEQFSLLSMANRQSDIATEVIGMSIRYPGQYRGTQCTSKSICKIHSNNHRLLSTSYYDFLSG